MPTYTQETQDATQPNTQSLIEPADYKSCWGLLYPIVSKASNDSENRGHPHMFNIDKREYVVGRASNADVRLTGPIVSNVHARIRWDGIQGPNAGIQLIDESRNGTWVKSVRAVKGHSIALHEGDEIAFGVQVASQSGESHRFTFRIPIPVLELKGIHVNYVLEQELGKGSFATVVKALHRQSGLYFAVKIIPRRKSLLQPNTVKMLEREMAILRQLDHPNIIKLCDVVPSDADLCLVMELVTGGDLFDHILSNGYLSEPESARLTAALCDAMAYIHHKGITHRDLKPENILLTRDNPPILKVADFGLAKCVDSNTMLRTMCGTPSYLAPEVVLQDSVHNGYDQKVDSWSVGAIVFAMLTGHAAFNDKEDQPLPARMKSRSVAWDHMTDYGCSQEVFDFVDRLLKFDPNERMSQSDALRHPWLYPTHWATGLPSYFLMEGIGTTDAASPASFAGSVMSAGAPVATPMTNINEEFQHLELESDSVSSSPAVIDFDDAALGGSSELAGSQNIRARLKEREQSWDIVEEVAGDPQQTPLARPRQLALEEEHTARNRPGIVTDLSALAPPTSSKKRKHGSAEEVDAPTKSKAAGGKITSRKASKMSEYDTPTTATRAKAPNGGALPAGRKASLRNAKGKSPRVQDFAGMEEEE